MEWESARVAVGSEEEERRRRRMMMERAEEELQILEAQHPNRFEYLKLDLKSFISQLHSQTNTNNTNTTHLSIPTSSPTSTRESSTRKKEMKGSYDIKRKADVECEEASKHKFQRSSSSVQCMKKSRNIDEVIAKAQLCLYKIKHFKNTF